MFSCFLISNCPFLSKLPRCKPQLPLTSNCCLLKYGITKYMLLFSKYRLDWMYFHIKLYHLNFHAKSRQKKYMMFSDTFQAFLLAFLLWNDSQCVRLCDVQQPKKGPSRFVRRGEPPNAKIIESVWCGIIHTRLEWARIMKRLLEFLHEKNSNAIFLWILNEFGDFKISIFTPGSKVRIQPNPQLWMFLFEYKFYLVYPNFFKWCPS